MKTDCSTFMKGNELVSVEFIPDLPNGCPAHVRVKITSEYRVDGNKYGSDSITLFFDSKPMWFAFLSRLMDANVKMVEG